MTIPFRKTFAKTSTYRGNVVGIGSCASEGSYTTFRAFNEVWSEGNRQRPKPYPLSPTPFKIRRKFTPTYIVPRMKHVGSIYACAEGYPEGCHSNVKVDKVDVTASDVDMANSLNRALSKFTGSLLNGGEILGEFKQTSRMVATRARQIGQAFSALRRGNLSRFAEVLGVPALTGPAPRTLKQAGNIWLEYEYGWRPLVSDVYDSLSAYHNKLKTGMQITKRADSAPGGNGQAAMPDLQYFHMVKGRGGGNVRTTIGGTVINPTLANLNALGILNPLDIAWNLTRFSFVVDWFLPVGDYLKGLTASAGLGFMWGCQVYEQGSVVGRETYNGQASCHPFAQLDMTIHRKVIVTFPSAQFGWKPNALSVRRLTSSLALLAQQFR